MSYPTSSKPILVPAQRQGREPFLARSAYSRDGSDSGQSQGWHSPRSLHRRNSSASRSSGGHSSGSDLMFPMDPENPSDASCRSGSSRYGSRGPVMLYDVPGGLARPLDPTAMPVCSCCGRQFYGQAPTRDHRERIDVCPSCRLRDEWRRTARRRSEEEFYGMDHQQQYWPQGPQASSSYSYAEQPLQQPQHHHRESHLTASSTGRSGTQPLYGLSSPHPLGQPFPVYNGQHNRGPESWTDLPQASPVVGSPRARHQLPDLITQLQTRRAALASETPSPRTTDPYYGYASGAFLTPSPSPHRHHHLRRRQ